METTVTEIGTGIELEIRNGKFFILEDRHDEKNVERFMYNNTKPAIDRIKELIGTVNADRILLSCVDISSKSWNITGIPWSVIAMGLIRGDVSKELLDGVLDMSTDKEKIQDNAGQKKK